MNDKPTFNHFTNGGLKTEGDHFIGHNTHRDSSTSQHDFFRESGITLSHLTRSLNGLDLSESSCTAGRFLVRNATNPSNRHAHTIRQSPLSLTRLQLSTKLSATERTKSIRTHSESQRARRAESIDFSTIRSAVYHSTHPRNLNHLSSAPMLLHLSDHTLLKQRYISFQKEIRERDARHASSCLCPLDTNYLGEIIRRTTENSEPKEHKEAHQKNQPKKRNIDSVQKIPEASGAMSYRTNISKVTRSFQVFQRSVKAKKNSENESKWKDEHPNSIPIYSAFAPF